MTAKAAGGAKAPSMGRAGGGAAMPGGYPCPSTGCVFRAARRYNLSVHMRLHTGEKPYKCDAAAGCSATFAWRSSMLHHLRTHHAVASSAGRRVVINNRPTKREAGGVRGARRGRGAASNSSSNSSGSGSSSQPVPGASTTPSVDGPKPAIALGGTEDSHGDGAPSARPEDATPTASTVATDGATASVNKTLSCLAAARKQSSAQAAAVPHAAASPAALSLPEGASSLSPMAIKFTPSPVPPLAPGGAPAVAPTPVPAAVASPRSWLPCPCQCRWRLTASGRRLPPPSARIRRWLPPWQQLCPAAGRERQCLLRPRGLPLLLELVERPPHRPYYSACRRQRATGARRSCPCRPSHPPSSRAGAAGQRRRR
eukprot:TRINITY_DN1463_c0_g1_i6.p1 TRINITY_DN1463_c0_g1~~TRINITY_DN1463_c0_g1_i6.p1  ORF type:complete len:370 (-),score=40.48 TRINITY_DN1463_c0_g1_i6:418-1527(-)